MNNSKQGALSVTEAAKEMGAHPDTIRRLIYKGCLKAFKLGDGPTSPWRITRVDLDRYLSGDSDQTQ